MTINELTEQLSSDTPRMYIKMQDWAKGVEMCIERQKVKHSRHPHHQADEKYTYTLRIGNERFKCFLTKEQKKSNEWIAGEYKFIPLIMLPALVDRRSMEFLTKI